MNAYAYARRDEDTHELSYAISIFDNGEYVYVANGRLGFGDLVHGAALSMHRLLTYIVSEGIKCDNIYTNIKDLLDNINSNVIQDALIQEIKAFNIPFTVKLERTDETDFTYQLFTSPFSIFAQ